ncbi:hypothetical protein F3Y22_tig00110187pilonHSYRG00038 [Hibiscus syriacus]|uniref:Uncharacterized protein n=1 Tax=Hibiscus syriacus TaxID=106335 RepID=A0A6A3BCQ3_HIBSY|nr:ribonuclease 1-like [Hibiscus syriacus]KAE8714786.1 hypothetical protein F3Y22_tig00110187pilonHSYRG00038 [Hibiscus syriacus]
MFVNQILAFAAVVVVSLVVSAEGSEFAFYKLSLRWPTTLCIAAPQTCKSPIPDIFTIHGLWPTLKDGTNVPPYNPLTNNCNPNPATNIVPKLASIRPRLEKKWPAIAQGNTNEGFWEKEWENHGKCSDYPQDPLTYFTSALNLAENSKYDPLKVLGVKPSDTAHDIETLIQNVKRNVGFYPQISCSMPIKGTKQLYLKEIRFCFTRGKPPSVLQNCPDDMDNLCRSVQPPQRTVKIPTPITINSAHNVTWELLASSA